MTENKKHKHEEQVEETQTQAIAESENTEQLSAEVDALKKKLADAESKVAEYRDSWMRS